MRRHRLYVVGAATLSVLSLGALVTGHLFGWPGSVFGKVLGDTESAALAEWFGAIGSLATLLVVLYQLREDAKERRSADGRLDLRAVEGLLIELAALVGASRKLMWMLESFSNQRAPGLSVGSHHYLAPPTTAEVYSVRGEIAAAQIRVLAAFSAVAVAYSIRGDDIAGLQLHMDELEQCCDSLDDKSFNASDVESRVRTIAPILSRNAARWVLTTHRSG